MKIPSFAIVPLALAACAAGGKIVPSNLEPRFDATTDRPVLEQVHTTGTVAPQYFHEERLVIQANGQWTATRTYPWVEPPRIEPMGTGSVPVAMLQGLVDTAFQRTASGDASFVELPATVDAHLIGGGRRSLTLWVEKGSHSVVVNGPVPPSFARLEAAIATATLPLMP